MSDNGHDLDREPTIADVLEAINQNRIELVTIRADIIARLDNLQAALTRRLEERQP